MDANAAQPVFPNGYPFFKVRGAYADLDTYRLPFYM